LYIVRYEDLVLDPKTTLQGLFAFLLDHDPSDIDGTNMARRIDEYVALG
jgi:NTP pyrophosphatase (non-canonical NTP hydrolase)